MAKKKANARGRGAPHSEIDKQERQRQEVLKVEKQNRNESKQPEAPKEKTFRDKVDEAQTNEALLSALYEKYSYVAPGIVSRNDIEMVKKVVRTLDELEAMFVIEDIKNGRGLANLEKRAVETLGYKQPAAVRGKISEYAKDAKRYGGNPINESFAEAFADVYSNGDNASDVSKAYVKTLVEGAQRLIGG